MADPDEALIEAIAEALRIADDVALVETNFDQLSATYDDAARAAYAAMVAHLGLVEEWAATDRTSLELEMYPSDTEIHRAAAMARFVSDGDDVLLRRLVQSRWTEVDHG